MSRPRNPDLTKYWKICLPATLAGTVELYLFDRRLNKPKYGSRGALIASLLEEWVTEQKNRTVREKAPNVVETLRTIRTSLSNRVANNSVEIEMLNKAIAALEPAEEPLDASA